MDDMTKKRHEKIQKNISKIKRIQDLEFGGIRADLINMYFAVKLESLTRVLICVTVVLAILVVIQIILLIKAF
jgi:hypothetical protein